MCLLLSAVSARAEPLSAPQPFQARLKNGLEVLVLPDMRSPTVVQMLWLKVGATDEVDGKTGLAHVLEHMMFKGTKAVPEGEFSKRVAALGGEDNAFTSYDYTAYFQRIPAQHLPQVMAMEADRFAHIAFSDAAFAKELEVIKEERRMRVEDQPRAAMREHMAAVQWLAAPYRRPVIGWMADLEGLTAQDARDFYQRWYVPQQAALVLVGAVQPEQAVQLAERTFGRLPAASVVPPRPVRAEPAQKGLRRMDYSARAEQAVLRLAYQMPSFASAGLALDDEGPVAQDLYALLMLAEVLDGYEGARLPKQLTQGADRVADSVSAYAGLWSRGPEAFVLQGVPAQGRTVAQLQAALQAAVAEVAAQGVTEQELRRMRNQYAASEVFKRDSLMGQAQEIGQLWALGLPQDAMAQILRRLEQVTPAQVQSVAQRYFPDQVLTIGTLTPEAESEAEPEAEQGAAP